MNKHELILKIAAETGLPRKDVELGLITALDLITQSLVNDEKVQLVGFGAFETRHRGPRLGRNPKTGTPADIPASRTPVFKPGKSLKEAMKL